MTVTAVMVKELRVRSGAGMMDAKKALIESNGDMELAIDWLRTKGLSKAAKKSDRTAAEGLVCIKIKNGLAVAVEVNSETDFVAKNSEFQDLVETVTEKSLECSSLTDLTNAKIEGKKVENLLTEKISKIGENLTIRRLNKLTGENLFVYMHNTVKPSMGKIGVIVKLSKNDSDFGKKLAMHIAAANPASLSETDLSPELIEKEKTILLEQARDSGKPEKIIENMVKGRIKKYFEEVTLLNQKFVLDQDFTVKEVADSNGLEILDFVRVEVGEGIVRKEEDFAAEVAKTISN